MPTSAARTLYLVAYDVADRRRLAQVRRFLLGWKVGGQKSCYECWLTPAEVSQVLAHLESLIDGAEDRVHVFQLDPRMKPKCFGVATTFSAPVFTIL